MGERIGSIRVSNGFLEQLLHLPEGHHVRGVRMVDNFSETFEVTIVGPSLPERPEDSSIPRVNYVVTVNDNREEMVPTRTFTGEFKESR